MLRAASTGALAGSAITGVASARSSDDCRGESGPCSECRDTGCRATRGSCTSCLSGDCEEVAGSRIEVGGDRHCVEVPASEIPDGAGKAVIKAANECHACDVADPGRDQTFCVGSKHAISHIEFAACPGATVSAACEDDVARVDVRSLDEVYYEVSYGHCDAADDSGRLTGDADRWSATVPIANCEGTVAVYAERGGERLDEVAFDCETASVSVDCPAGEATVAANDSGRVFYEIDYGHCDADDVSRTALDLSGAVDSVSIPVADCEGTITVTDDDGRVLDEAAFDCESAGVSVDCEAGEATIAAPDTSEVRYEVDYADCDADDVGPTPVDLSGDADRTTVPVADCAGAITLTDDDGRVLDEATVDCESVADLRVDCEADEVLVEAPDTNELWYEIAYDRCDAADVPRTRVPGLSESSDVGAIPGLPDCEGTVRVFADEASATPLATTDFDCETASVSVDCAASEATITAPDADEVRYEVAYDHCDAADVGPETVDLSGDVDSVAVSIANCEGTITLTDDDGRVLDEAAFDCETATASVDCAAGEATISAPDTDAVSYEVAYDHCDASDVGPETVDLSGDTDAVTVPVADCEGSIALTDDDGRVLDETAFDCESAGVSVDCVAETATISAPDAERVWYAVDYDGDCPTDGVSRTGPLDLGGATDAVTVDLPGDCAGAITVTDDDERELARADFDCSPRVTDLAADCERVVATFDAPAVGDAVAVDVEAVAADGSTVGSVSSDRVPVERVDATTGEVAVDYGSAVAATSWDAVDVQVTHADLGRVLHSETVSMDGSCGCRECSSDLDLKFEGGDLRECTSLDAGDATFTVTDVETKHGEGSGEVMSVCFATEPRFCELDVAVKAGPHVGSTTVTPTTGADGDCPGVDAGAAEFCVDVSVTGQSKNAISWVTIQCP